MPTPDQLRGAQSQQMPIGSSFGPPQQPGGVIPGMPDVLPPPHLQQPQNPMPLPGPGPLPPQDQWVPGSDLAGNPIMLPPGAISFGPQTGPTGQPVTPDWLQWQQPQAPQNQLMGNDAILPPGMAASQLQGNDPSMGQNQLINQAAGIQGPGGAQGRQVNYAGEGQFAGGNNNPWPGFDQGYPWTPYDPTAIWPAPQQGWNSYPAANAQMQMLNALSPGFTGTIPPGYAGFDPNSRANQFNLMSGMFANDPMELPGEQAGPMLGAAANLTMNQALNREGRNDMAQQGLLDAIFRTGNNPGLTGSTALSSNLAENPFTTSSDALQGEIEGLLNRRLANAREGALSTAQGALGSTGARGGEAALLESGVDFGSRAAQADALANARINQAMRRAQDIQNAQNQFRGTSDIFGQSMMGPAAIGAEFLSNRTNVDTNALIEQMRAMAGLGMAENIRKDADVSTLEAYMPGIVNLLGNLFGGLAGSGGGG